MKIENSIERTFGPSVIFAGYVLTVAGILALTQSLAGIFLIIAGAFIAFSVSGTVIEKEKDRLKYYTKIFGIFKQGRWENLSDYHELTITKNRKVRTVHSLSDRTMEIKETGYYIYLVKANHQRAVPVKRCKTLEEARIEIRKLSEDLEFPVAKF